MSAPKLKSGFRARAIIRQCSAQGMNAVVVRKGDEDAGDIVIKVNLMSFGFRVYFQVRDAVSELAWLCATGNDPVPESAADLAIAKAVDRDWDVWVLEIEDELGAASVLDNVVKG